MAAFEISAKNRESRENNKREQAEPKKIAYPRLQGLIGGEIRRRSTAAAMQGSLTLWHSLRTHGRLPLQSATRGIDRAIAFAATDGYEWVFVDTAPTMWVVVQEAIRVATLVIIPARPGFFDLASIHETIAAARQREKPFAVVINAAPPKRDDKESPAVIQSRNYLNRLGIPVWAGQISHRAAYSLSLAGGASACESEPGSTAAAEISALWSAIARSAEAVNAAHAAAREKHGRAA